MHLWFPLALWSSVKQSTQKIWVGKMKSSCLATSQQWQSRKENLNLDWSGLDVGLTTRTDTTNNLKVCLLLGLYRAWAWLCLCWWQIRAPCSVSSCHLPLVIAAAHAVSSLSNSHRLRAAQDFPRSAPFLPSYHCVVDEHVWWNTSKILLIHFLIPQPAKQPSENTILF